MWAYIAKTESSGIGALGIDLTSFLFQLISFVIVLVVLKKFVFRRIVRILDERARLAAETIALNEQAHAKLQANTEAANTQLHQAQQKAQLIIAEAHDTATALIHDAESSARQRAHEISIATEERSRRQAETVRQEIKQETASLVALTVEKLLRRPLPAKEQERIIVAAREELVK